MCVVYIDECEAIVVLKVCVKEDNYIGMLSSYGCVV